MNFNVLIQNMGANQLSYNIIRELNKLSDISPGSDVIVFYENIQKNCLPPNFAVMQIAEAWYSQHPVIATSLSTAHKLITFPAPRKLFLVWDVEWVHQQPRKYEEYSGVYLDKELELVARSPSHKTLIENAFNRPVNHVIDGFNIPGILEILNETKDISQGDNPLFDSASYSDTSTEQISQRI